MICEEVDGYKYQHLCYNAKEFRDFLIKCPSDRSLEIGCLMLEQNERIAITLENINYAIYQVMNDLRGQKKKKSEPKEKKAKCRQELDPEALARFLQRFPMTDNT